MTRRVIENGHLEESFTFALLMGEFERRGGGRLVEETEQFSTLDLSCMEACTCTRGKDTRSSGRHGIYNEHTRNGRDKVCNYKGGPLSIIRPRSLFCRNNISILRAIVGSVIYDGAVVGVI